MVMGGCNGVCEGVIPFRRCDSPQGGVKGVGKVCQLMERCDAQRRGVMGGCKGVWECVIIFRMCDSHQGGVGDIRKVCQLM